MVRVRVKGALQQLIHHPAAGCSCAQPRRRACTCSQEWLGLELTSSCSQEWCLALQQVAVAINRRGAGVPVHRNGHRRRATFERCEVFVGGVRLGVAGVVLAMCVCVSVSGVLFSVGVCVCDLLICSQEW